MTLTDLRNAVYDECNHASSPATAVTTRVTRFLNEGIRMILGEPGMIRLADSDAPHTFPSVAGTARYAMTEAVAIIKSISERTNDLRLLPMTLADYRALDPDATSTSGTPTHYVPIGRVAVKTQPSDASAVYIKSTSASDGAGVTVQIEGIRTDGYPATASQAMNGVTAAAIGSLTDFIQITDFWVTVAATGTITLHEDSGAGTELARIVPGAIRPRYYAFYLWPTPAAAITYYVDYRREVVELSVATDEPPLPTDLHPMLVAYAVMREAEKTNNTELYARADARYRKFMANLKYQTQVMADEIPVMGRGRVIGRSHFGPDYPADYWTRV